MSEEVNHRRRRFLGTTAMTIAAAQFGSLRSAHALISPTGQAAATALKRSRNTSFAPLKQIEAGLLSVGYAEAGPPNGPAVVLLHGWPYDIHSYVDVAPLLASKGYRVIVPHLRGYGTTRFLSRETFRNGQPSVVAVDAIALMDALKIETAIIGGFDWGREPPTSWRRCGRNVAKVSSPSADTSSGARHLAKRRCRQPPSSSGGTNIILRLSAVGPATTKTGAILRS